MKKVILILIIFPLLIALGIGLWFYISIPFQTKPSQESIKIGILHSLTGTMALSEKTVVNATQLAIQEINNAGGVLGKQIEPIVIDGKSDWPTFQKGAETLLKDHQVPVVFGCWTSASRKMVKPVFERYNRLLFYPVQYEGLEESPNIIYTGATVNQQVIPGVVWGFENLGKTFFLVGSDYVFPRTANEIIKKVISSLGGTIVEEEYLLLGSKEVSHIISAIKELKPAVIINTINGDSNIPFFKELRKAGITPERIPTISFSIAEPELKDLGVGSMIGDYACWNYFESVDTPANDSFIEKFTKEYGASKVTSDPMEAAYFGVHVWANAVRHAGTTDPDAVKAALKNLSYNAPEGVVTIDPENQHTWKQVRIGKIQSDGQFNIIWDSQKAVRPMPYPIMYQSKKEWDDFLQNLYKSWQNQWAAS